VFTRQEFPSVGYMTGEEKCVRLEENTRGKRGEKTPKGCVLGGLEALPDFGEQKNVSTFPEAMFMA